MINSIFKVTTCSCGLDPGVYKILGEFVVKCQCGQTSIYSNKLHIAVAAWNGKIDAAQAAKKP